MAHRPGRSTLVAGLIAFLLPLALYWPTLSFGFLFDDRPLLIENPVVQHPQGIVELFTADLDPQSRVQDTPSTNYLRPLFLILATWLYAHFGAAPFGWHLAAVVLHALLGVLVFALFCREGVGNLTALAASLLYCVHPLHVQSTAWVSGLQDLLFAILAVAAYGAYRFSADATRATPTRLLGLGLAYAMALLAKEPAIGLLLLVAGEVAWRCWWERSPAEKAGRRPWAELGWLALLTIGYFGYRWAVFGELAHRFPTAPALPAALASVPIAVLHYLLDLFWPIDLFLLHPARPVGSWLAPSALGAAALLFALVALAVTALRRQPQLLRPFLWFGSWLAPTLALWAVNPEWMVMDRYLLVPSLALPWSLALLAPLEPKDPLRSWRLAIASVLILILGGLSILGWQPYRSEALFWQTAVAADPGSSTAWTEMARLEAAKGEVAAAHAALDRAITLDPQAQLPRLRRALLALKSGQNSAAIEELESLIARNPGYLPAWRNLVVARDRAGDGEGTRRTLDEALQRFPKDPLLWTHRAVILRGAGRSEEALVALSQALALAPRDPGLYFRQALLLKELGRPTEAQAAARQGLQLDPPADLARSLQQLATP